MDGHTCPRCGAAMGDQRVGNMVVRDDGLVKARVGDAKGSSLFRVCWQNGLCGIAFWDKAQKREVFKTVEELKALLAAICGYND